MSDLFDIWTYSLISFMILVFLPVIIPYWTVKLIRKRKMHALKRMLIITISSIAEILTVAIPWSFIILEGVSEWLLLLLFYSAITLVSLGPIVLLLIVVIQIVRHIKTRKIVEHF